MLLDLPASFPGSLGSVLLAPAVPILNNPGCLFGPAPTGGFPYTPGNTTFAINWGLDQNLKTPYAHVFNFSIARQFSSHSSLQIAYVGTIARRLPMQVDLAMPANLKDPASGTKYFQAATMLSKAAAARYRRQSRFSRSRSSRIFFLRWARGPSVNCN